MQAAHSVVCAFSPDRVKGVPSAFPVTSFHSFLAGIIVAPNEPMSTVLPILGCLTSLLANEDQSLHPLSLTPRFSGSSAQMTAVDTWWRLSDVFFSSESFLLSGFSLLPITTAQRPTSGYASLPRRDSGTDRRPI